MWMRYFQARRHLRHFGGLFCSLSGVICVYLTLYLMDVYEEIALLDDVAAYGSMSNSQDTFPDACRIRNYDAIKRMSIVYTWVNGSLPCQQANRRKFGGHEAVGGSRDREIGELQYSIRSLKQYLPWHEGNIFIVTPGHIPHWMNLSHPRIQIIQQEELFPDYAKQFLPTFNTNAIEQFLYRIPGLSDLFMQINDDYIFTAPMAPHDFFSCNGGIRVLREPYPIAPRPFESNPGAWMKSVLYTQKIMDATWGHDTRYFLKHAPYVYIRRAFERVHTIFRAPLFETLRHRFRSETDMNMPLLHHYYMVAQGHKELGIPVTLPPQEELFIFQLVMLENKNVELVRRIFQSILAGSHASKLIALNDEYTNIGVADNVHWFLSRFLPQPSEFELPKNGPRAPLSIYNEQDGTCALDPSIFLPMPPAVNLTNSISLRVPQPLQMSSSFFHAMIQGAGLVFGGYVAINLYETIMGSMYRVKEHVDNVV